MKITNAAGYEVDILPKHQSKIKYLIANNQHDKVDEIVNSYDTGGPIDPNKIYQATQDLPEVTVTAPRTLSGAIANAHKDDSLLGALLSPITVPFEAGSRMVGHMISGNYEYPSDAINRTKAGQWLQTQATDPRNISAKILSNPIVQDMVLDPANLIGLGEMKGVKKGAEELINNAYRVNPWAFKPNPEALYRGIGEEGYKDAIKSGVFRPNQNVSPYMQGTFDLSKSFNNTYYTPKFKTADQYGKGYIAEVPKDAAEFRSRYARGKDWSQLTNEEIPVEKGRILKKDWLQGYKEVPKVARNVVPLDDPIPIMDKVKAAVKNLYEKPFIPTTQVDKLPSNISLETIHNDNTFRVKAIDDKDNIVGYLSAAPLKHSPDYPMVTSVGVTEKLRGNRLQDVLYQKAVEEAQAKGLKGIRSGDSLTKPEITEALQGRFNKTHLESGSIRDIYGLEGHTNPNVISDWMNMYSKMNKNKRVYVSPKDIINKFK